MLGQEMIDESVEVAGKKIDILKVLAGASPGGVVSAPDVSALIAAADRDLVAQVYAESRSYGLAAIVALAMEDKQRENQNQTRVIDRLTSAIVGLRQFAPVERMTSEQRKGYNEASMDLLMVAAHYLRGRDLSELPALGGGPAVSEGR